MTRDTNLPHRISIERSNSGFTASKPTKEMLKKGQARARIEQIKEQRELEKLIADFEF